MTNYMPFVEQLFRQLRGRTGEIGTNPVTSERWVWGYDPIKPHKERAARALVARAHFEWDTKDYAPDAPPLPLSDEEIYDPKMATGLPYLVATYAQSLRAWDWKRIGHANFGLFARCVMGCPRARAPNDIKKDPVLLRRFPPYPEDLLGPGLTWRAQRRQHG
jgi:hypothetical protein